MASCKGIRTSHAGSLPRPPRLIELNARRGRGEIEEGEYEDGLAEAVAGVVGRQREVGIDLVNDGEYGHSMRTAYDYGAWWSYVFPRLGGLELVDVALRDTVQARRPAAPGEVALASFGERRDWNLFADAYGDPGSGVALPPTDFQVRSPVCRAPISYIGHEALARDIADMKAAMAATGATDGFLNAVAPASCARIGNEFYASDEELIWACADAMREEYHAIVDAGLTVQLDDPAIAESWDQIVPEPSVEAYQRFTKTRIEALNHAIRGLPPERIRFHLCWGSWHGPHVTDIAMADIVELMLEVDASAYSFEAANARHEHEWRIWEDVRACAWQDDPAGRRHALDERRRASRARRRADRTLRRGGRARPRDRVDRLRSGWTRPPPDRLGQARVVGGGRGDRKRSPVTELGERGRRERFVRRGHAGRRLRRPRRPVRPFRPRRRRRVVR